MGPSPHRRNARELVRSPTTQTRNPGGISKSVSLQRLETHPAMLVMCQAFLSHNSKEGNRKIRRSDGPLHAGDTNPDPGCPPGYFQVQKSRTHGIGGALYFQGRPSS